MRLLLVRHGQDDPAYRGGWSQRGLIEAGQVQALAAAYYLKDAYLPIDCIISSDLRRAVETTNEILTVLPRPVSFLESWREINNGDLAGMSNALADIKYPGLYFKTLGFDQKYPNGESPRDFQARVVRAWERLADIKYKNVLIVTHGGFISTLIHHLKKLEWSNTTPLVPCKPTGIFEIIRDDARCQIVRENDCTHLKNK
jgi:probable phosphoglycerate mutase